MAVMLPSDNNVHKLLSSCVFFVEADNFTRYALQCQTEKVGGSQRISWEHCDGWQLCIGEFGSPPTTYKVHCALIFWKINGHLVCFYDPISNYVSWPLVDEFFSRYWTKEGNTRKCKCDADNFHQCLGHIRDLEDLKKKPLISSPPKYKPHSKSDPQFMRRVREAYADGKECFEDSDYGHVCLDRF